MAALGGLCQVGQAWPFGHWEGNLTFYARPRTFGRSNHSGRTRENGTCRGPRIAHSARE